LIATNKISEEIRRLRSGIRRSDAFALIRSSLFCNDCAS
jgi:hypothetical protein